MDALRFFGLRYDETHAMFTKMLDDLPERELRGRPHPAVNSVAWLLWHSARIEDVALNRFVTDGRQVFDDRWHDRLAIGRRDVGTGMTAAEVDDLGRRLDLAALRDYWLAEFWANDRSHGWILLQTGLLHPYAHGFDARVTAGLWGHPSP